MPGGVPFGMVLSTQTFYPLFFLSPCIIQTQSRAKVLLKKTLDAEEEESKKKALEEKHAANTAKEERTTMARFTRYLEEAKEIDGLIEGFLERIKDMTGASSVYAGHLRNDDYEAAGRESSGMERDPERDYLKYIATTDKDQSLLTKRLEKHQGVTHDLFLPEEEKEDEYEEEVYNEETGQYERKLKPKPEEPPRTVFVPNVLMGHNSERMHFFNLPKAGCYFAVRIKYDSCLHDGIFDEADVREREIEEQNHEEEERRKQEEEERKQQEAEEEAERKRQLEEEYETWSDEQKQQFEQEEAEKKRKADLLAIEEASEAKQAQRALEKKREQEKKAKDEEEKLIGSLVKHSVNYAICFDTLGQNRRFNDEEIMKILKFAKLLTKTLVRIDRETFKKERGARKMIGDLLKNVTEKSEEDRKLEMDARAEELKREEAESGNAGEGVVSQADVSFDYHRNLLQSLKQHICEFRTYNVFRGPLQILQCLLYLVGNCKSKEEIADSDNKPLWNKVRVRLNDELFQQISNYDPRQAQNKDMDAEVEALRAATNNHTLKGKKAQLAIAAVKKKREEEVTSLTSLTRLVEGLDDEAVRAKNYPLFEVLNYVRSVLHLRRWTRAHRKRREKQEREEALAKKLAEEEEARAKAEADAAAAAAAAEAGVDGTIGEGDEEGGMN